MKPYTERRGLVIRRCPLRLGVFILWEAYYTMKQLFEDLPGWTFEIDEVSANVYEVTGKDGAGRSVLVKGTDPDALLEDARQSAKKTREVSR